MLKKIISVCFFIAIPFIYSNKIKAQLCTGSLGDPVVNITFGTSGGPIGAKTNYNYVSDQCPNDGSYTIASSSPGCFGYTWHTLNEDHTPNDASGMMMVVNASFDPGVFYVDTVHGLCSNTTYEFASWILNLLLPGACTGQGQSPILPNITFIIKNVDGTPIDSLKTGDIASTTGNDWKQYGFYFATGNISDVVILMKNNQIGGCGNDLALDDITFRPCGPAVNASIKNNGSDLINICKGDEASLLLQSNVSSDFSNPVYQWQQSIDNAATWSDIAGATSLTLPVTISSAAAAASSLLYRLTVNKAANINYVQCRIASNIITIKINEKPLPVITGDSLVCEGKDILLTASNGNAYRWSGPNNFSSTNNNITINNAAAANAGTYSVNISTTAGCSVVADKNVMVNSNPVAAAGSDVSLCEGSNTQLQGSGGVAYSWSPVTGLSNAAIASPVATPADTIMYILTVTNSAGCTDTAATTINVWKKPTANAGLDKKIMQGQSVQLDGEASGTNVKYNWSPNIFISNPQVLQPMVSPVQDTTYTLHVQSLLGCGEAEDKVFVRVFKKVDIPNTFSPNGDGIHDVWFLKDIDTYPDADVMIFNRWGQQVFKSKGSGRMWDGTFNGKPLPVATYYYVIDLKNDFPKLSGWVMILR